MKKPKIHTLNLTNELNIAVTLWLMPWGRDYTMLPGDKFVVEAASWDADFDMTFSLTREGYYVYTVGNAEYVVVLQNNRVLELGHNRDSSPSFPKA